MDATSIPDFLLQFLATLSSEDPKFIEKLEEELLIETYQVKYDLKEELQRNLLVKIVKKETQDFDLSSIFARELVFYQTFLKEFDQFLPKISLTFPKFIKGNEEIVAFEAFDGQQLKKVLTQSNLKEAETVLEALGSFHGASFAFKEKNPKIFNKYRALVHPLYEKISTLESLDGIQEILNQTINVAIDSLETHEAFRIEKLEEMKENVVKEILSYISPSDEGTIVLHGEFCLRNLKFPASGVVFTSPQPFVGSPILDLSHFIFTSLSSNVRNDFLQKLLRVYYEALAKQLKAFDLDVEKIFSWNTFQDHLRRFGGYGLVMVLLQIETIFEKEVPTEKKAVFGVTKTKNELQLHLAEAVRDAIRLGYI